MSREQAIQVSSVFNAEPTGEGIKYYGTFKKRTIKKFVFFVIDLFLYCYLLCLAGGGAKSVAEPNGKFFLSLSFGWVNEPVSENIAGLALVRMKI